MRLVMAASLGKMVTAVVRRFISFRRSMGSVEWSFRQHAAEGHISEHIGLGLIHEHPSPSAAAAKPSLGPSQSACEGSSMPTASRCRVTFQASAALASKMHERDILTKRQIL